MAKFLHCINPVVVLDELGIERLRNGFTAAYEQVDKRRIMAGLSVCGENDSFSKKIGRMISEGRMKCERTASILTAHEDLTPKAAEEIVLEWAEKNVWGESD